MIRSVRGEDVRIQSKRGCKVDQKKHSFHYLTKSKFVRSMFLQVLSIFLIVGIAIVVMVFFSFASEINKNIIAEKQKQLAVIEDTISKRMEEISSIAYNIGKDPTFYLEPVDGAKYSGYEMANTLERYLIGNGFIQYLAYHRLSEPDRLYTSRGEISFQGFWRTYLHLDEQTTEGIIQSIRGLTSPEVTAFSFGEDQAYFAYTYPLPQFSQHPQAFVLMMIPLSDVAPLLETQLMNSSGVVAVFDASGKEIYRMSTLEKTLALDPSRYADTEGEAYETIDGKKYVVQKRVSESNGWTYLSVIRLNDIVSGLASRQLLFIVLLLALMFVAVFAMLVCIAVQYRPISKLAETLDTPAEQAGDDGMIDKRAVLSSTFAALKGDSEQKQRFETAYHEAEAANKAKSAFLSSMSHDIRTPMNAIIGMTAIAYKHADDPEYVRDCLDKVQVASQYLLDIINNVLDMSRIESGRFTLAEEVVELPRLVYGIMTILNQSVETRRQRFRVEAEHIDHEKVIGDNVRLTQVFMNILSNAVKFTPEGGTIGLHILETGSRQPGTGEYVFTFTDTGIGMSPEFVEHVFDTFTRAKDATVSKVEGTGLGMAIARNLVEMMGGTIRCESELGKGTTFTVTLQQRFAGAESEAEKAEDRARYRAMRELIVDGEEWARANEAQAFTEAGAQADCARTPDQAAEMAARALSEGRAYRLAVLNETAGDPNGAGAAGRIIGAAGGADTAYALAVKDLVKVRQTETKSSGIAAVVQIPLYRSTVVQLLDRTYGAEGASLRMNGSVPDLMGRRVLVAEDNAMNREIAKKIIGETRADTVMTVNGREAVDAFKERPEGYFDVILMDLQMPVMNGYEATAAIRSLDRTDAATVPIYALTASTFDEDVRQVREASMSGHIGKPYTPDALYRILSKAILNQ